MNKQKYVSKVILKDNEIIDWFFRKIGDVPIFGIKASRNGFKKIKYYVNIQKNVFKVIIKDNEIIDWFFSKMCDVPIFGIKATRKGFKKKSSIIFMSNPTTVLRLCCVVVGVVTIPITIFLLNQTNSIESRSYINTNIILISYQ